MRDEKGLGGYGIKGLRKRLLTLSPLGTERSFRNAKCEIWKRGLPSLRARCAGVGRLNPYRSVRVSEGSDKERVPA
jgi:hypothetical protein